MTPELTAEHGILKQDPFPHFSLDHFIDPDLAAQTLHWLQTKAPWRFRREFFYTQEEVNLTALDPAITADLGALGAPAVSAVRARCEQLFATRFAQRVKICAHRLLPGFEIGIHNDDPAPGMETHRVVVQLTPASEELAGGELALYGAPREDAEFACFPATFNQAVGMALSDRSYHRVRKVERGQRITLIYSFWSADCADFEDQPNSIDRATLDAFVRLLSALGADRIPHSGTRLLDHLLGTFNVLDGWNMPPHLCLAGLFHSVYGAPGSTDVLLHDTDRADLKPLLGERAETLAYRFAVYPRRLLFTPAARQGASTEDIDADTRFDLLMLDLANRVDIARREPELVLLTPAEAAVLRALPTDRVPYEARRWIELLLAREG